MIKVIFEPWKEVVIHEKTKYSISDLAKKVTTGLQKGSYAENLWWVDGVLLTRSMIKETDDVVKEKLKGRIHFSAVDWAIMPKYRSVIRLGLITVPIVNLNNNQTLRAVAKALKTKSI